MLKHSWYLTDETSFSNCSWRYSKYILEPTKSNLWLLNHWICYAVWKREVQILFCQICGTFYVSVGTMKKFKRIVIMCKFFFFYYLVHFYTKHKIISLGMWSEHNTPCLLVLLNEFITYIYLYTHLYTYVCICIYVLKFCLLYLITECGFLIQWCLLADKNNQKWILFVKKSLCVSLFKWFSCWQLKIPTLSTQAASYPRKFPKLNVNIQHLSVWVYLLASGCCDWLLKIVPLSTNALVLALIIFKRKQAIEFSIWFILKLVLLVFARTIQ